MKKIFLFITLISLSITLIFKTPHVFGQTPTEAEDEENIETIERIKDLVASKVAELDLVERRGIIGKVKNTGNTQITLIDHMNEQKTVDIDELTEFDSDDSDDFGISDIDSGDEISVVGLYNKDSQRILARFISLVDNIPLNIDGKITAIDEEEFSITVLANDSTRWTVDIETSTDTYLYEKDETEDSGFSELELGKRVIIIGFEDTDEEKLVAASRIIVFSDIPPKGGIEETITPEVSISPSAKPTGEVEVEEE